MQRPINRHIMVKMLKVKDNKKFWNQQDKNNLSLTREIISSWLLSRYNGGHKAVDNMFILFKEKKKPVKQNPISLKAIIQKWRQNIDFPRITKSVNLFLPDPFITNNKGTFEAKSKWPQHEFEYRHTQNISKK